MQTDQTTKRTLLENSRALIVILLLLGWTIAGSPCTRSAYANKTSAKNPAAAKESVSVDDLKKIEADFQKVIEANRPSVVAIKINQSFGSGVIVSQDGLVLTAGHVAHHPGSKATIYFHDGTTAPGVALGIYRNADAGMVRILDEGPWPVAKLGKLKTIRPGDWCLTMGHPLGYRAGRPPVARIGRVLQIQNEILQTDCALIGGDSGGPLLDQHGKVIGINSRIGGPLSMNFHVHIGVFHDHWARLKKGKIWCDKLPLRDADPVRVAFEKVLAKTAPCQVEVKCDGNRTIFGTIVGPDGWILTKASELSGRIVCRLADGRDLEARLVGMDRALDLAMLKIDADELPSITWAESEPSSGQWVAATGPDRKVLGIGIVGAREVRIPAEKGSIGIMITQEKKGITIVDTVPKSPAARAGLKKKDVITHLNRQPVKNRDAFSKLVRKNSPGTVIKLRVLRGGKRLHFSIKLTRMVSPAIAQRDKLNAMGLGVSRRRQDFASVLQHDCPLTPGDCGGPLFNLDGQAIGINIARGGRTETYCLTAETFLPRMHELMSGQLRPEPKVLAQSEPIDDEVPVEALPETKPEVLPEEKSETPPAPSEKPESIPTPKPQVEPENKPQAPEAESSPEPPKEEKSSPEEEPKPSPEPAPKPKT